MEQFCSPTRRYQDILEWNDDHGDFEWTEVQLGAPVEDFLAYCWDWKDLQAFLIGGVKPKLLWITENAFLMVEESCDMHRFEDQDYLTANIRAASGEELALILVQLVQFRESDKSTAELGVFWRAVATSNSVRLTISEQSTRSN